MGNIVEDFVDVFQIRDSQSHKKEHYQLTGSKNTRSAHDVNFNVRNIYNIFTKKVMPKELAKLREIVEEKYLNFVNEQLTGEKSIWDAIKVQLPAFVTNNKLVTTQVNKRNSFKVSP